MSTQSIAVNECDFKKKCKYQKRSTKKSSNNEEKVAHQERNITAAPLMRLKLQDLKKMCLDNGLTGWSKINKTYLMSLKLQELKQMCRDKGLSGWSKLNKLELVEFLVSS